MKRYVIRCLKIECYASFWLFKEPNSNHNVLFSYYSKEYCIWFITYNGYFTVDNTSTEFYFELFMFQNTHSIA